LPQIVQDIGAYAGLASVVGLAILAALYFSQARDVKRLREWAGRAPERVAEGVAAPQIEQRVVATPQTPQPAGQKSPAVPGQAAPAQAAAAGAKPATAAAKPAAATAAAKQGQTVTPAPATAKAGEEPKVTKAGEEKETAVPVGATAAAKAGAATPEASTAAPAKPAEGTEAGKAEATTPQPASPATPAASGNGPRIPGLPSTPAAAARRSGATQPPRAPTPAARASRFNRPGGPSPSETAILPPASGTPDPWFRRLLNHPRNLVLAILGVLIIGGGAAAGLSQLGKNEAPSSSKKEPARFQDINSDGKTKDGKSAPAINPKDVTVAILNGTTVPGLAAQIGDKVEKQGFQLGNITNNSDQTRNESVVLFAPGHTREAAVVSRRLGITPREPIDPQSQALGGDAGIVVIAGQDQTP
jgi:hypothetical protein